MSTAYGIPVDTSWVTLLQQRLHDTGSDINVVNASISGDTSTSGRDRLPTLLARHRPGIVVIELGGNDGLRGLSPSLIRDNLESMILASKKAEARVVLIGIRIPPNYGPSYVADFHAIYEDLAEQHEIPLVPFMLAGFATEPGMLQDDGIHPTAAAQPRILDNVWPTLAPLVGQRN